MGDFTPTTGQVVSAYVWAVDMDDAEAREEEVRRWLTEHDRDVRDDERGSIVRYLSAYPTAEVRYLALFIARMGHHDVQ